MNTRLALCLAGALLTMVLFLFVPDFNWIGYQQSSLYEQYGRTGEYVKLFIHLLIPSSIVFIALGLILGFGKRGPANSE